MDDLDAIHHLGKGWVGDEALAIAVYCALKYSGDIDRALMESPVMTWERILDSIRIYRKLLEYDRGWDERCMLKVRRRHATVPVLRLP